ncbi:MAG: TonB-dependent siderophore receptor, partial [Oceanobacter sp.]
YDEDGDQMDPQEAQQYELGTKFSSENNKLNAQLALFDITKRNIVEENTDGYNEMLGAIESRGAEFNGQYQVTDQWQLQANAAWVKARITETTDDDALGNAPAFAPVHTASFWTRYNYPEIIAGGFVGGSFGARYQSERYTDDQTANRVRLPGYRVLDAAFYYERMNSKYSLSFNNLTNQLYYVGGRNDIKLWPGEPAKVTLAAQFDF